VTELDDKDTKTVEKMLLLFYSQCHTSQQDAAIVPQSVSLKSFYEKNGGK
jgi:hypothetical protein